MAAGVITLSTARKFDVQSNSCASAIQALYYIRPQNQTNAVCSSDPVAAGSTVTFTYSSSPTSVVYTVSSTTATAPSTMSDVSMLTVVLVVFAVFLAAVLGYRQGFAV